MTHDVQKGRLILTINGGSSSIKFALYEKAGPASLAYSGMIERIGIPDSVMTVVDRKTGREEQKAVEASDHRTGAVRLI